MIGICDQIAGAGNRGTGMHCCNSWELRMYLWQSIVFTHMMYLWGSIVFTHMMYLWWSLCTLCLLACQVNVIVGDFGLCCICVTSFEH